MDNEIIRAYNRLERLNPAKVREAARRHGRSVAAELYPVCRETLPADDARRLAELVASQWAA